MHQLMFGLWHHFNNIFKAVAIVLFLGMAAYLLFAAIAGCLIDLIFYLRDRK